MIVYLVAAFSILSTVLAACDDDPARGVDADVGVEVVVPGPDAAGPDVVGRFPEAPPSGYVVHDLGDMATLDGESEDFTFDVPQGAVSLHVTLTSHAGVTVALLGAAAPDGTWVVTDVVPDDVDESLADGTNSGFGGLLVSPNKSVALPRASTTLIPNSPRIVLTPGRWTFRVGAYDPYMNDTRAWVKAPLDTTVRVGVVVRTSAAPTSGTVDLVLSFDPTSGLSASTAQGDADIRASLDVLDLALAEVGLAVGEVTYRDVVLTTSTVALRPPGCSLTDDVAKVFDEAPSPRSDAVHVIFLGRFTCKVLDFLDLGEQLGALSIGAPGMPFATRTGIITSTFAKPTYPQDWAEILAHEVGHYLGLFHTRESTGFVDNIADTLDDEAGAADNLMFFNVTASTATTLTADQGAIVRLSPLIKPD